MVRVQLLGAVAAFDDAGEALDIGPAKSQAVLAALALSTGTVVSVPRLVELVWGEDPPRTAEKTLQSYVTRLRKALGEDAIARVGAAYQLRLDPAAVDAGRFERAVDRGDVEAALAEWTGMPLAGLDAEGLSSAAASLTERWLGAMEARLAAQVDTDPAATVAPLSELVAEHPFREALWGLLMTALYRSGRQADALAAYRSARDHLVDALGVEPGPALRALESRILAQDDVLLGEPAVDVPPAATVTFAFVEVDEAMRWWADDPHETAAAMARYEQLVRAGAAGSGGEVFSSRSGSFGVAFGEVTDALAWAEELQAGVQREPWPRRAPVRVRIGLHSGPAAERTGNHFGPEANLASSLATAAHGGQTLLSRSAAALAPGAALTVDLGHVRIPDVPVPVHVVQLGHGTYPPVRTTEDRRTGNLPRRPRRLIGRDEELPAVCEAVRQGPLVTLIGPGGIGKTRLALAAAQVLQEDFDGGAWSVELAAVEDSSGVLRAVADAVGVGEGPGRALTRAVVSSLRERRALLLLDNCEHVLDGAAAVVDALIESCPGVHVIATSRARLGVEDERTIPVGPLDPVRWGAELFRACAAAADPGFDPHRGRAEIEEICRRLDGVPLAIELAAARIRTMEATEILERLDDALRLLADDRRGGVEHHRTLRLTIEWSYQLLSPVERQVFQRLSPFVGHFDLRAAEVVAAADDLDALAVDDVLGRLVDQSLVLVEAGPFGRRFRLLESIRQFGAEHLKGTGDARRLAARHAGWCIEQVDEIHDLIAGPGELEGVARLDELWPNLRAAVDRSIRHGDASTARDLIAPIAAEALVRSRTEIADWAERLLAIAPPDDTELVVFALSLAARRYWRTQDREGWRRVVGRHGDLDHPFVRHAHALVDQDAEALLRWCPQAAAELRKQGDEHLAQLSDIGVARSLLVLGRFAEADEHLTVLADRYRRDGPPSLLSWMLTMLGYSAMSQGRLDRADELFDESTLIVVPPRTHTRNRPIEALAHVRRGEEEQGLRVLHEDVEDLLETEDIYDMTGTAVAFMSVMAAAGRHSQASRIRGFLEASGQIGTPILVSIITAALAHLPAGEAALEDERASGRMMDGRGSLLYMRDVLTREIEKPR